MCGQEVPNEVDREVGIGFFSHKVMKQEAADTFSATQQCQGHCLHDHSSFLLCWLPHDALNAVSIYIKFMSST